MQELIEDINAEIKLGTKMCVNWDMYLEKEKQHIIEAVAHGNTECKVNAEEYYNETFIN